MINALPLCSLLLALWGSARAKGSFYAILFSCLIAIVIYLTSIRPSQKSIPNEIKVLAGILALFQVLVFAAHLINHGFSWQELLYVFNVPLLYLVGSFWVLSASDNENLDRSSSLLNFLPFCYAIGAVLGSLISVSVGVMHNISASNFRPHELLYSIGVLIALLGIIELPRVPNHLRSCFLLISLLVFLAALKFRGVIAFISAGILFAYSLAQIIRLLVRGNKTPSYLFIGALILVGVLAGEFLNIRTMLFKWTLYSLISDEPLNGRIKLWVDSLSDLRNVDYIGSVENVTVDPHNFILNTLSHSGLLPSLLVTSVVTYTLLALLNSQPRLEKKWHIGVVGVLIFGSMIQPVQFADGIAYQLSFFAFGVLSASSSRSQLDCRG